MLKRRYVLLSLLVILAGCAVPTAAPSPTATSAPPTPTWTPSPTPTPAPTPTPTPIPPATLTLHWPKSVSALEPAPIEVDLVPPPGVNLAATVSAVVVDPAGIPYQLLTLLPRAGGRYAAKHPLQLPLEPLVGDWQLVVDVVCDWEVVGERELLFRPELLAFRELTETLPGGVDLRVPQVFVEMTAQGTPWAGGRVWRYGDAELALWWAPGPTEPLLYNNALVMLEATHDPADPPVVQDWAESAWGEQIAFRFAEEWPGRLGGPAEAWVIQDTDSWLYVLRGRTLGGDAVLPVVRQVVETFTVP